MAEELKDLIEKIQTEGIKAAEEKAQAIRKEAEDRSAAIIAKAKQDAERLVADARDRARKDEEALRSSLKQAARDTILTLKQDITALLDKVIQGHVQRALTGEEMARMILGLVKGCGGDRKDKIIISLRKDEAAHIEKALLAELGAELRKGITLKGSSDIRGGFLISFDSGTSSYDFTDRAIAEYIASILKPELGALLKEAVPEAAK